MEYIDGSNLLLMLGTKCIGHCTSHELTYTASTKERIVKPPMNASAGAGKWTEKSVDKLSISGSFDGLRFDAEAELGVEEILRMWEAGTPVTVKGFKRGEDTTPYLVGQFIVTSVKETNGAGQDATYSGQIENSGQPSVFMPTSGATE